MKYTVRIKISENNYEDNTFSNRMDALDFIYRKGATQGIDAQLVEINDSNFFKYEYTPKLANLVKYLNDHDIKFEVDDGLNLIINFRDLNTKNK